MNMITIHSAEFTYNFHKAAFYEFKLNSLYLSIQYKKNEHELFYKLLKKHLTQNEIEKNKIK